MNYLSIGFIGGVLAFAHCLGMCGGFALHLSQNQSRLGMIYRQLLWNVGRTLTYVFLGALAGFIGYRINLIDRLSGIQTILTYVTGAVMILMGALSLGLIPTRRKKSPNISEWFFVDIFQQIFIRPTSLAAFVLGLATGFLPCPIVVAFLALSIKSGSVSTGMATMAAMGLGTMWSLLLVGLTGHWINLRFKKWSTTVGGVP
jgi:sulfite exporter TauE/SafE